MDNALVDPTGIVSRALEIYREHASVLFPVALIVALVQAIVLYLLGGGGAAVLALVVTLLSSVVFQAMVVELVRDVQEKRSERPAGELLNSVTPVVPLLLVVSLLAAIGTAIGTVLLIVPGLIALTFWSVVSPVVVVERPGVGDTFRRSTELVRGNGWPVFGVMLLIVVLVFVVVLIGGLASSGLGSVGGSFVQLLISAAVMPVAALVTAVLYYRLVEIDRGRTMPPPSGPPHDPDAPPPGPSAPPLG